MPALFTRTSTLFHRVRIASAAALTTDSSERSPGKSMASQPVARMRGERRGTWLQIQQRQGITRSSEDLGGTAADTLGRSGDDG